MTTRNFAALFTPRTIALVGASNRRGSVGAVLARNLYNAGFAGHVIPVNTHSDIIHGVPTVSAVPDLPAPVDLAVIAIPPEGVPQIISELGQKGCRAAVIVTAGFDARTRQRVLDAARPYLMRIVGPNGLGFISTIAGINASFSHLMPLKGGIGFVTQSGAIATSIIDWANGCGVGFSHILSLGDMSDVDFGDCLDFLALDQDTKAIFVYAEAITQARKFMSAARIASRAKPVIVVKGGRSAAGALAAKSHTGALAGADAVYDAAFRRAGMLRVDSLGELFGAAETLASGLKIGGDRLAILTNGGGLGVLAADALEAGHGRLARLSDATLASLDKALPASWSHGDPVDILGDAHGDRYDQAISAVAADKACDALLVMNCPTGVADNLETAEIVIKTLARHPDKPTLACWMGGATASAPRHRLSEAGVPNFETPEDAVKAFLHLATHQRNQRALFETPDAGSASAPVRQEEASKIISAVLAEGRALLTEPEAKAVLAAYGIPVVKTRTVATPAEATQAALEIGGPVAIKILSRQISHKSDVGGVVLDLETTQVAAAAESMLLRVAKAAPHATIDGVIVEEMVHRPLAQELILGATVDPTFGPCILFGHGGIAAEVIGDRVIGLPPLNRALAVDMIERTKVARLLAGYRNRPAADLGALANTLIALSDLMIDLPEVSELDINPLLADDRGVIALDARLVVRMRSDADTDRLAIRPYPRALVRRLKIEDTELTLRPIRPVDAEALRAMTERCSSGDLHLRFHGGMHHLSEPFLARLTQIDYDREMALVAEERDRSLSGVARLVFDPNFATAECAILVRMSDQRRGIGKALLNALLEYARERGAEVVVGDISTGNERAIGLVRRLGGSCSACADDLDTTRATFLLTQSRLDPAQTNPAATRP